VRVIEGVGSHTLMRVRVCTRTFRPAPLINRTSIFMHAAASFSFSAGVAPSGKDDDESAPHREGRAQGAQQAHTQLEGGQTHADEEIVRRPPRGCSQPSVPAYEAHEARAHVLVAPRARSALRAQGGYGIGSMQVNFRTVDSSTLSSSGPLRAHVATRAASRRCARLEARQLSRIFAH
jgi:hypothetical protein